MIVKFYAGKIIKYIALHKKTQQTSEKCIFQPINFSEKCIFLVAICLEKCIFAGE
jgi:hypothetical protein